MAAARLYNLQLHCGGDPRLNIPSDSQDSPVTFRENIAIKWEAFARFIVTVRTPENALSGLQFQALK